MRWMPKKLEKIPWHKNTDPGGMFKMENDPQVTPIGRFIRKTSLWWITTILQCSDRMSLVGTRPQQLTNTKNIHSPKTLNSTKPGITGLWQVSGRSEIKDLTKWSNWTLRYMDDWTIWKGRHSDLAQTIEVVLRKEGRSRNCLLRPLC